MDKTKILERIGTEYTLSKDTFQQWREKKLDQFSVIFDAQKPEDKVSTNLFASLHKTFIALSYADELTVKYQALGMEDEEVAENFEILAKADFARMWLDKINYLKQSDRATYNLSIRLLEWGKEENRPVCQILDPMSWYADPNPTWFSGNDYRWHWFETVISKEALEDMWYDTEWLWGASEEKERIESRRKETMLQSEQDDDTENKMIWLYNHFFIENGIWYKVMCDSSRSKVLDLVEYGEKCPIILNFYDLKRWSATWGASILDMTEDKERASNKLFNLMYIKSLREWLWGDFIYDADVIKDTTKLANPSTKRRYIRATNLNNKRLSDAMMELPQSQIKQDVSMMKDTLKRESQTSVGIDSFVQWVRSDQSITATESQTIQQNANLNLALNNKVDAMWEKDFWSYIFTLYQEHFDASKKVIARLNVGFGSKAVTLEKKDFGSANNLDVIIVNKSDKQAQNEKEKLNIPYYQWEAQNPEYPKVIRNFFKRKIAKLSGMTPDEIKFAYYDYLEEKAKMDLILLNENEDIAWIDANEDQTTYLMIYKRWVETKALAKWRAKRQKLLEQQMQKKAQGESWLPAESNKMLDNQMMANSMSQQRQQSLWNNSELW